MNASGGGVMQMTNGTNWEIKEYKGWQDVPASLIPLEDYKRLSRAKGVEFYGTPFCLGIFVPGQKPTDPEDAWEAHWVGRGSGLQCFKVLKKVLAEFYKKHYNAKLVGITPCTDKKAVKMARLLGFWPTGQFLLHEGTCYILSIKEGEMI